MSKEKKEILGKIKELFGMTEKIKMAEVNAILKTPISFEIPDDATIVEGLEVELTDGMYELEDGTSFDVVDGVITSISDEVEVDGVEDKDKEEEEMSSETVEKVEEKNEVVESLKNEIEEMKKTIETLNSEKVEMSSKIEKLEKSPAEDELKTKKSFYTKQSKEEKFDRLKAIREAMK